MTLSQIRLELARTPEFPQGSPHHGYEFIAPLNKHAHIDSKVWIEVKDQCEVLRFWGDQEPELGVLRRVGTGWQFDYMADEDADDEPLFKLDRHLLAPAAYVSIRERDGVQRPFRVVSVAPLGA